jgi:hypothetical protein
MNELDKLVEKWRKDAAEQCVSAYDTFNEAGESLVRCADELEAALKQSAESMDKREELPISWADFWQGKGAFDISHDHDAYEVAVQWAMANITAFKQSASRGGD